MANNWPKQHNKPAEGRSPPQELEVGPHSGPYLLANNKWVKPIKAVISYQTNLKYP